MFGCSDVYHWLGRTAKAVLLAGLRKSHNLDAMAGEFDSDAGRRGRLRGDFPSGSPKPTDRFDLRLLVWDAGRLLTRTQVNPTIRLPVENARQ